MKDGWSLPEHWQHPDDLVFEDGSHVKIRGGDPVEAAKDRQLRIRFRDIFILQAEKDRRNFLSKAARDQKVPIFVSDLLVVNLNSSLPPRMQLNHTQLLMRIHGATRLRKRDLIQQLRKGWADLDIPAARHLITPPIAPLVVKLGIDVVERWGSLTAHR